MAAESVTRLCNNMVRDRMNKQRPLPLLAPLPPLPGASPTRSVAAELSFVFGLVSFTSVVVMFLSIAVVYLAIAEGAWAWGIFGALVAIVGWLPGLTFGGAALRRIDRSGGRLAGKRLAKWGIYLSWGAVLGMIAFGALFPFRGGPMGIRGTARTRMSQLTQGCLAYVADNEGQFPRSDWPHLVAPYIAPYLARQIKADAALPRSIESLLHSPVEHDAGRAWAMNAALATLRLEDIAHPSRTVLLFESKFGSPLSGGPELLTTQPLARHVPHSILNRSGDDVLFAFVDGSVRFVSPEESREVVWNP